MNTTVSQYGVVSFINPGIIDPKMWSTFGVSVKTDESAIGCFGSGLKYAIAVLLREGRKITIHSGGKSYEFSTKSEDFRGQEFQQCYCNGEKLPFTTHLGHNWEPWQAYRELYSNCLDEGGSLDYKLDSPLGAFLGYTQVDAELGDIVHSDVFLDTSAHVLVDKNERCEIYKGESSVVYYKGIRAMELPAPSMYTYNILEADLTEDRTIKYSFEVDLAISSVVLQTTNTKLLWDMLLGCKDKWEETISYDHYYVKPHEVVINFVDTHKDSGGWIQEKLKGKVGKFLEDKPPERKTPTDHQRKVIDKAMEFCTSIGYPVTYPVYVTDDLPSHVLAIANRKDMVILMSSTVLGMGVREVVATLIEENIHLKKGLNDMTRDLQDYLFSQIVSMGEKLTGEVL